MVQHSGSIRVVVHTYTYYIRIPLAVHTTQHTTQSVMPSMMVIAVGLDSMPHSLSAVTDHCYMSSSMYIIAYSGTYVHSSTTCTTVVVVCHCMYSCSGT